MLRETDIIAREATLTNVFASLVSKGILLEERTNTFISVYTPSPKCLSVPESSHEVAKIASLLLNINTKYIDPP